MQVKITYQTQSGIEDYFIKEVSPDKTVNIGYAVVPLKEVGKWLRIIGYKLIKIEVVEAVKIGG